MRALAGSWSGTYEYLDLEVPGSQPVGFTLEIFRGSSWRVRGAVFDDPATGMDGRGTISGWSWGRYIWFKKVMPHLDVRQDPKPIPLDDYLQAQFGEHLAGDPGQHAIWYRGVVGCDRHSVTGTWRIPHRRLVLSSGRVLVLPFTRGIWEMHRQ
jgi:hypothetical protein